MFKQSNLNENNSLRDKFSLRASVNENFECRDSPSNKHTTEGDYPVCKTDPNP